MPSAPIDGDIGCGFKQKSPQIADGAGLIQTQQPNIGFLGNFQSLIMGAYAPSQKADQCLVVFTK
jgi:hypothetical protein